MQAMLYICILNLHMLAALYIYMHTRHYIHIHYILFLISHQLGSQVTEECCEMVAMDLLDPLTIQSAWSTNWLVPGQRGGCK